MGKARVGTLLRRMIFLLQKTLNGISKWEAEQVLWEIACNSKLGIVIIRLP
jgi:hypothetical protein